MREKPKEEKMYTPLCSPRRFQPTVNLVHHIVIRILIPRITRLVHNIRDIPVPFQLLRLLHDVDVESLADVPRDMTVERPHARVVE